MKRSNVVRGYIISVMILFFTLVTIISILHHSDQSPPHYYYEWIWFVMVGFGALSVFGLLANTMTLEKPRDFARLPVYEFFALSILVVSLVLGVVYFPTHVFPADMMIQKKNMLISIGETDFTGWVINIGGTNEEKTLGLQIPIFVLVAGNIGAYLRYLYGWVQERKIKVDGIYELTKYFLLHKKIVNCICISTGLKYENIKKHENIDVIKIKHLHKTIDNNRGLVYFLPPISATKFAEYIAKNFERLYEVESEYEKRKTVLRSHTYEQTIDTISLFFLAPILAVVSWLLLQLSGIPDWKVYAVVAFSAGLTTKAVVKRLQGFVEEKIGGKQETSK